MMISVQQEWCHWNSDASSVFFVGQRNSGAFCPPLGAITSTCLIRQWYNILIVKDHGARSSTSNLTDNAQRVPALRAFSVMSHGRPTRRYENAEGELVG